MTQDSEQYQVPITRRVMRHVEYSRAGDHVVFRQIDDAGNAQQICMPRDQAELLVQWMLDDLFPDDGDPDGGGFVRTGIYKLLDSDDVITDRSQAEPARRKAAGLYDLGAVAKGRQKESS